MYQTHLTRLLLEIKALDNAPDEWQAIFDREIPYVQIADGRIGQVIVGQSQFRKWQLARHCFYNQLPGYKRALEISLEGAQLNLRDMEKYHLDLRIFAAEQHPVQQSKALDLVQDVQEFILPDYRAEIDEILNTLDWVAAKSVEMLVLMLEPEHSNSWISNAPMTVQIAILNGNFW